jgi:hypothetical protein
MGVERLGRLALSGSRRYVMRARGALLVVGGVMLAFTGTGCGGGDDSSGESQPPVAAETVPSVDHVAETTAEAQVDVFTFADEDLCEWIDADELAGFFTSVYGSEVEAELVPDEADTMGSDECRWRLTGTTDDGYYEVHAWNADPGALLPVDEIVESDGGTVGIPGGTVSGHPALSDGVVVQSEGWGIYAFWVPPRDNYLALAIMHNAGGSVMTGVDSGTDLQDLAEQQTLFFTFADQMIRELGCEAPRV